MSKGYFTSLRVYSCLAGTWHDEETGHCQDETLYFDTEKEALDALDAALRADPRNQKDKDERGN